MIVHRSGKKNSNADALSRFPLATLADEYPTCGVVATLTTESVEGGDLAGEQRQDMGLAAIITFLETGVLPEDERLAKQVALTSPLYTVEDGVLYRVEKDATLRLVPRVHFPDDYSRKLMLGNLVAT